MKILHQAWFKNAGNNENSEMEDEDIQRKKVKS